MIYLMDPGICQVNQIAYHEIQRLCQVNQITYQSYNLKDMPSEPNELPSDLHLHQAPTRSDMITYYSFRTKKELNGILSESIGITRESNNQLRSDSDDITFNLKDNTCDIACKTKNQICDLSDIINHSNEI